MNSKMIKIGYVVAFTAVSVGAAAQEFGDGASVVSGASADAIVSAEAKDFKQDPQGAMAQDQAYVENESRRDEQSAQGTPEEVIGQYMRDEEIPPYDPKTGRIVVQSTVTFDVRNPKISADFIGERTSRMMELLMNAKAEVVKTICTKMSAERVLAMPANPIRKQLEKEETEIKKQIEYTKDLLEKAGVKLDEAKLNTKKLSIPELMAAITDVFKSQYAAKLNAEKKAEYELAKKDYDKLEVEYKSLVQRAKEMQSAMDDDLQKTSHANVQLSAGMQIHGCSILDQAEGAFIRDGAWKYQISATFSWSEESQSAAEAILGGRKLTFEKNGKHTVSEWLDHYAKIDPSKGGLADWIGPRTYIDENKDLWYLGIYAAPALENAIDDEKAVKTAALLARAEVGYALYADLATENSLEALNLDYKVDGKTVSRRFEDYNEKTTESFKNLVIYGMGKIGPTYTLRHSTGHQIHVVVMGVNASQSGTMRSIHENAKNVALRINTMQEIERGRYDRMKEQVRASKDNPAARAIGSDKADVETEAAFQKKGASGNVHKETATESAGQREKTLRKGTRFTRATDDF